MSADPDFSPLLAWYRRERRELPWRRTRDPYAILVSEVMLQQTRVETVIPFFQRFLERFPSAQALAAASLEDVNQHWAGLGYYSRARNLQRAARAVVERGAFPESEPDLRELAGVGEYTAAALASIAFGQPAVALDGNALRVLARLYGYPGRVTGASARKTLRERTMPLIPAGAAGDFTQALMELGARLCLPRQPRCLLCPMHEQCVARREGATERIPALPARRRTEKVAAIAFRIRRGEEILLEKRPQDVFLADQWVPPWFLRVSPEPELERYRSAFPGSLPRRIGETRHGVTFRDLTVSVYEWETEVTECSPSQRWTRYEKGLTRLPRFSSKILEI